MGETRAALRGYRRLLGGIIYYKYGVTIGVIPQVGLTVLKPTEGLQYLHASKEIARLLHEREDVEGAKNALRDAVNRHPNAVSSEGTKKLWHFYFPRIKK